MKWEPITGQYVVSRNLTESERYAHVLVEAHEAPDIWAARELVAMYQTIEQEK